MGENAVIFLEIRNSSKDSQILNNKPGFKRLEMFLMATSKCPPFALRRTWTLKIRSTEEVVKLLPSAIDPTRARKLSCKIEAFRKRKLASLYVARAKSTKFESASIPTTSELGKALAISAVNLPLLEPISTMVLG